MMKRIAGWMCAVLLATALPTLALAAEVELGAGDVVKVSVYNNPDLALETRVSESGSITFPLIGKVEVGGLSPAAAEQKIAGLLESGGFLRKAQVNLIVTVPQAPLGARSTGPGGIRSTASAASWTCWPWPAASAPTVPTA
jgi:polysaccharide export outer membrane protein